jgi:hypothetical protein
VVEELPLGCCTSLGSSVRELQLGSADRLTKCGLVPALSEGIKASQPLILRDLTRPFAYITAYVNMLAEVPIYLL